MHSEDKQLMQGKSHSEETLCEGCRKIDFTNILRNYSSLEDWNLLNDSRIAVHHVRHVQLDSACPLCNYLLISTNKMYMRGDMIVLCAYDPRDLNIAEPITQGSVLLKAILVHDRPTTPTYPQCFELSQVLQPQSSVGSMFKYTSGPIDWTLVKRWIEECESAHDQCKLAQVQLPELVLIDCEERRLRVCEDANVPYVALSYVWGAGIQELGDHDDVLGQCPRVVEDSMTVVKSLGMRFLWVDRYCIPQKNAKERHRLIRNMGSIYANSFITLIAAAGEGADCGLPGVSVLPRWDCSSLELSLSGKSMVLKRVRTIYDSYETFHTSKWKKRGWTYQEGLHARRRLIFTRGPLCLECFSGILFSENYASRDCTVMNTLFHPLRRDDPEGYLVQCIQDFSAREFTYECDALDAFRGTLELLKNLPNPYSHLCGVVYGPIGGRDETTAQLARGLMWSILDPVKFQSEGADKRREGFPSWSWLGWRFERPGRFYAHRVSAESTQVNIAVELSNGLILKCEDGLAETERYEEAGHRPVYLHISAWSVDFPKGSFSFEVGKGIVGKPIFTSRRLDFDIQMNVFMDASRQGILRGSCRALLMNDGGWWLLVRQTATDGIFERIGILQENIWARPKGMSKNLIRVGAENITTIVE